VDVPVEPVEVNSSEEAPKVEESETAAATNALDKPVVTDTNIHHVVADVPYTTNEVRQ
jgi:hypothetical protein